jgi:serine/threonine protein kinase
MRPDLLLTAFLAAARKQRLISDAQALSLHRRLRDQNPASPAALRDWLAGRSGLPSAQLSHLVRLLPPADGRTFAPYRTLAHLASGGMGTIWLAEAPDGALVVVKTLSGEIRSAAGAVARDAEGELWIDEQAAPGSGSPGGDPLQRLERETRITRSLDHHHIVRCLDHGLASDGTIFLVLEFMADGDLKDLLEDHGPLPEPLTLSIGRQIAAGLEVAHRQLLLHRDVKPGNVFLTASGHAKLADFGFARSNQQNRTQLTLAGAILGSPLYMAPEQITPDAGLDIRCDLYGLGCVLFHCLTGTPPYTGSLHQVMRAHCTAAVPDVRKGHPEVSRTTAELITRLLHKDPDKRFRDPTAAKLALIEAMAGVHLRPDQLVPLPRAGSTDSSARLRTTVHMDLAGDAPASGERGAGSGETAGTSNGTLCVHASDPSPSPGLSTPAPRSPLPAPVIPSGITDTFLTLAAGDIQVCLWARPRIVLGKLRGPGVDVCLRNYPEELHREACIRISRGHLACTLAGSTASLTDLGSANGTRCNGQPLTAQVALPLQPDQDHLIEVAQTVTLRVRAITAADGRGLAAVIATRPRNRSGLSYALVQQHVRLGAGAVDIVLPDAQGRIDIGWRNGQWEWGQADRWQPLSAGSILTFGGLHLTARSGTPADL